MSNFVLDFVIPLLCIFIVMLIVMTRPIKLLQFKASKNATGVIVFMGIVTYVPLLLAQHYLEIATGELTVLNSIDEVDYLPKTKYYSLKEFYFDKTKAGRNEKVYTSGKHNQTLNFKISWATPIFQKESDTIKKNTHYWLCEQYQDDISNRKSNTIKKEAFEAFKLKCIQEYNQKKLDDFKYLERLKNTTDTDDYSAAAGESKLSRDAEDIFFIAHKGNFEDRCGNKLLWVFIVMGIGSVLILLLLAFCKLKSELVLAKYLQKQNPSRIKEAFEDFQWLLPREGFYVSLLLIYANILIFSLMVMNGLGFTSFSDIELIDWGSLFKPDTVRGEWWRLLTYQFVNNGCKALLNNMLSLLFIGICLEPLIGKKRTLALYIIGGLCGGIIELGWEYYSNITGSSPAVMTMYGVLLVLVLMKVMTFESKLKLLSFSLASVSVAYTIYFKHTTLTGLSADIGGLVTGLFLGALGCETIKNRLKNN
jgi:membrane associated rhomboid family serine protease